MDGNPMTDRDASARSDASPLSDAPFSDASARSEAWARSEASPCNDAPCSDASPRSDESASSLSASLSLAELEAQITELAGHLNAANYRWLTLIGEFDRRNGWADGKLPSCAHWLNFKCGLNLGAAREKV
ncbi:MAG TPA: hypothetical protein VGN30_01825, partial [Steroidobacteraceae bacterium]